MSKIIGNSLKNIPWQEKPENYNMPIWRYTQNPIINRNDIPSSNSIFNSAVVPFKDGFAGVFRCDSKCVSMDIFAGFSKDVSTGKSTMSQLLLKAILKLQRENIVMIHVFALSKTDTILHGVTDIMDQQSV